MLYPRFLNEDGRIRKNRLSMLYYQFQRYASLCQTDLLESKRLQSYYSLLQFFTPNFGEDCNIFAFIEIQTEQFKSNLHIFDIDTMITQLTTTIFLTLPSSLSKRG